MSKWTSTLISYKPYLERGNNTNTSGAKREKGRLETPPLATPFENAKRWLGKIHSKFCF